MATVIDLLRHLGEHAAPDGGNALAGPVMLPAVTDSPLSLPLPPAIVAAWARLVARPTLGHHALALSAAQTQRSVALMGHGASPHEDLLLLLLAQLQRPPHPVMLALMPPDESLFRHQLITLADATGVRWIDTSAAGNRVAQAQLVLATPADLHRRVLRYHDRAWRWLWPQLRFVALPELHRYTGAVAGHLHWLLRRVERLATHAPLQLLASLASVADVGGTLTRLLDRPMHVVAAPDGPSHSVLIALWRYNTRRETALLQLAEQLNARRLAITVFGRDEAETSRLRAAASERGIALPDEARVALVAGVPRTIDERQQLLRSGYRLLILLSGDEPHELLFAAQPDLLLNALPQWPLATYNPYVVAPQLTCAAVEHPLEEAEIERWTVGELRDRLIKKNVLQPLPSGDLWQSAPDLDEPYTELDPGAIGGAPLTVLNPAGAPIATLAPALQDRCALERQVFAPGLQVASRDHSGLVVQLAPDAVERDTIVLTEMTVRVREELAARTARCGKQTAELVKGKIWASQRIVGLRELRSDATERRLAADVPHTEWLAAACWITCTATISDPQAIGWTITQALPIVALAQPAALAVTYDADEQRLYLIEVEPGGVGIIDCLYQEFEKLIDLAALIAQAASVRPMYQRLAAAELAWIDAIYGRESLPAPIQPPPRIEQAMPQSAATITPAAATATTPQLPITTRPDAAAMPRSPIQTPKTPIPTRVMSATEQPKAPPPTRTLTPAAKPQPLASAPTAEHIGSEASATVPHARPQVPLRPPSAASKPGTPGTPAPVLEQLAHPQAAAPIAATERPAKPPARSGGDQIQPPTRIPPATPTPAAPLRAATPEQPQRSPEVARSNDQRLPTPATAQPTAPQRPAVAPRQAPQPATNGAKTNTPPEPSAATQPTAPQRPAATQPTAPPTPAAPPQSSDDSSQAGRSALPGSAPAKSTVPMPSKPIAPTTIVIPAASPAPAPIASSAPPTVVPEATQFATQPPAIKPENVPALQEAAQQAATLKPVPMVAAEPAEQQPRTTSLQPKIERRPGIVDRLALDQPADDQQDPQTALRDDQAAAQVQVETVVEQTPPADQPRSMPLVPIQQPDKAIDRRRITAQYSIDDLLPPLDDEDEQAETTAFVEQAPVPTPAPLLPAARGDREPARDTEPNTQRAASRPQPESVRSERLKDATDEPPVDRYPGRRAPQPPARQPYQRNEPQRPFSSSARQNSPPPPRREPPAPSRNEPQRPYQPRGPQKPPPNQPQRSEPPVPRRDQADQRAQRPQRQAPPPPPQREPRRSMPSAAQPSAAPEPEADVTAMIARMRRLREEREANQRPTAPRPQHSTPAEPIETRFHIGERVQCQPYGTGIVRASSIVDGREQVLIDFPEYGEIEVDPVLNLIRALGSSATNAHDEADDI